MNPSTDHPVFPVNVGPLERFACGVVAGWLLSGVLRRGPGTVVRLLLAAALSWRAWSGNCKAYEALGVSTCSCR